MKRSDVSDRAVCEAVRDYRQRPSGHQYVDEVLVERLGVPEKVAFAAMERASRRGLIDYGLWIRAPWLTEQGKSVLAEPVASSVNQ